MQMAFPLSSCEICFSNFTNQQTELFVLSCSHPICKLCARSICIDQSIVCPVCWKMTHLHYSSGSLLGLCDINIPDGRVRATTMLEESFILSHTPIQERKIQNEKEQTLLLKIGNGNYRTQLTEIAVERNESTVGNLNSVCKEVSHHGNNDLTKQHENNNPIEIEMINGKLKLKVPKDQHGQPSKSISKDINLPKSDFKIIQKNESGEMDTVEIKAGYKEKGENFSATRSTSNQEITFRNKKDPLIPILLLEKKNFFVPKFGVHKIPSKHYRVKIKSVFDPYRLYVQILDDDLKRLDLLNKQLQLQFKPFSRKALKTLAIRNPTEGCVCAVLYGGFWQRGIVQARSTSETVNQTVQVMIVDTGFCCLVHPSHIQPLQPNYLELPVQAVRCKLSNVLRFELRDNNKLPLHSMDGYWPPCVIDLIHTKREKMAEISVLDFVFGVVGSISATCETTLLVTIAGDDEYTSVNQQIDDAIADVVLAKNGSKLVLQSVTSTAIKASRRRSKRNNKSIKSRTSPVTQSATPTNALEPNDIRVVIKTVPPSRSTSKSSCQSFSINRHMDTSCQKKGEAERKSQPLHMNMWTFADLKTILPNCFNGVVTWVDDSGGLYVHDCTWSKELLHIRDTLNATFNRSNSIKTDLRCHPNDPCLAKYESNWYRATTRAVNKEQNTAKVFFIDYGATVDVQLTDIRMDTILKNIPVHTFRCTLYNLLPHGTEEFDVGTTWPDTVINFFHAVVVNQEFNMNIKCYSPLIIDMRFRKNSMNLTNFMVTARAGEYINQSK